MHRLPPLKPLLAPTALVALIAAATLACAASETVVHTVVVEREVQVEVTRVVDREVRIEVVVTPTPQPTVAPTPVLTPTRVVKPNATPRVSEDYYVIFRNRSIEAFVDIPALNVYWYDDGGGGRFRWVGENRYDHEEFHLNSLLEEGSITQQQKLDYLSGGALKIPFDEFAITAYKFIRHIGYDGKYDPEIRADRFYSVLLYYFDEPLLDPSTQDTASSGDGSYFVINDGDLETFVTDALGNTTRVKIGTVDVEDLFRYWARENKLTLEQTNTYGETRELVVSAEDLADAAEFGIELDETMFELDEQTVDRLGSALQFLLESD